MTCPKCGSAVAERATACPKCGLAVDRMATFAAARDAAIPDALGNAWDAAVAHWEEPARHEELMRLVAQHDAYAWAAGRYRSKAGDPIADKQLARVRKAAEVTLMASAAARQDPATKNPYRATTTMLVMLVLMLVAGLVYAMVTRARRDPTPPAEVETR